MGLDQRNVRRTVHGVRWSIGIRRDDLPEPVIANTITIARFRELQGRLRRFRKLPKKTPPECKNTVDSARCKCGARFGRTSCPRWKLPKVGHRRARSIENAPLL